jgi:hypothetical protein
MLRRQTMLSTIEWKMYGGEKPPYGRPVLTMRRETHDEGARLAVAVEVLTHTDAYGDHFITAQYKNVYVNAPHGSLEYWAHLPEPKQETPNNAE